MLLIDPRDLHRTRGLNSDPEESLGTVGFQVSTPDLSNLEFSTMNFPTPDFSTPDFSTPDSLTPSLGLKNRVGNFMVEKSGG